MELADFLADVEVMTVDELMHHGVKGMHWGVRKDRSSGGSGEQSSSDHAKLKKAAKIGGVVLVAAVVIAGSVYLAKHPELLQKVIDSGHKAGDVKKGKEFVESLSKEKEPTGVINAAGAGHMGDRIHRRGGLPDVFNELQKAGIVNEHGENTMHHGGYRRYGANLEKAAVVFNDPEGRNDAVGRPITHRVVLPKQHAQDVTDFESAKNKAWSLLKNDYQRFSDYANSGVDVTNAEARRRGLMD